MKILTLRNIKTDINGLKLYRQIGINSVLINATLPWARPRALADLNYDEIKENISLSQHIDAVHSAERHSLQEYYVRHCLRDGNGVVRKLSHMISEPIYYASTYNDSRKKGDFMLLGDQFKAVTTECEMTIFNYCKNSIKNHFGKDFEFYASRDIYLINEITNKFIKKYDNKFRDHVINEHRGLQNVIMNNQFFIVLDSHTFIYVASGNKIGRVEERYMMNADSPSPADLYMYIFGKHCKRYIRELNSLIHKIMVNGDLGIYIIDKDKNTYENNESRESLDVLYSRLQPRDLSTLFFSNGEKDKICDHIDKFIDNEKFYKDKQLLYKTGILFYGEPGTGKSSLVKAIATKYNRSIVAINMQNIKQIDLNKLTQSINVDEEKRYIILLEDIDTLFLNRVDDQIDKDDQAVINKLLQFLDSNTSPTNVIFIATTNHINRLDDALLREGRFDIKVEIHPLKYKEAIMFCESFELTNDVAIDILNCIDNEFKIHDNYNQSRLQARILSRLQNKSIEMIKNVHGEMEDNELVK